MLIPQASAFGLKLRLLKGSSISAFQPSSSIRATPLHTPSQSSVMSVLLVIRASLWAPFGLIMNQ